MSEESLALSRDMLAPDIALVAHPSIEVQLNPESNRTILAAGGMGNDGIALARAFGRNYLLNIGSVLGIRYAQTNVDPDPIVELVDKTVTDHDLRDNKIDVYLGSAAGVIMAEPLRQLSERLKLGKVIFDGSPHDKNDVLWVLRNLITVRFDALGSIRAINYLAHIASDLVIPPATDKESDIPLEYAEAHRSSIVTADTITLGLQAAAIRRSVEDGLLKGAAEEYVYVHSTGVDPLVDSKRAIIGWGRAVDGPVREVVDPYRPTNSHAMGPVYPRGLVKILQGSL